MKRLKLGGYIVTDPDICHGKPTLKGTRIMVKQVLDMIAQGIAWDEIIAEYDGAITREAIAEAVRVAGPSPVF